MVWTFTISKRPKFGRLLSKCPNHEKDCANFCGLLRKAELYVIDQSTLGLTRVWLPQHPHPGPTKNTSDLRS